MRRQLKKESAPDLHIGLDGDVTGDALNELGHHLEDMVAAEVHSMGELVYSNKLLYNDMNTQYMIISKYHTLYLH